MAFECRIGIDFHGVLNVNPCFFKEFIDIALKKKIAVHIISGGPEDTIRAYLTERGIKYTKLWCIYDYYARNRKVDYFPDGSFRVSDDLWNRAKAQYCKREHICLHIDDSMIYGRDFQTPYCLYDERKNSCRIAADTIIFTTPAETLRKLLPYCREKIS